MSMDSIQDSIGSEVRTPRATIKQKQKTTLSDFEVGNKIGAGTFGVIVRATELKSKREFALKMMSKKQIQSKEHAEHIVREKEILMYLSEPRHSNHFLVKAYSAFHDEKSVYLQMDLVKGCDLLSRIRANEPRVKNNMHFYLAEVICALEHLHNNYIVYRDLKPEHVMIDGQGHCQLVDFGFAKRFSKKDVLKN